MSLTYTTFTTSLANMLVVPVDDPFYVQFLPNCIDDAEQRAYRDLQLLNTIQRDSTGTLTAGLRTFQLPTSQGIFVVVEEINVITPSGVSNPELGRRNFLTPVSKEVLNALYPDSLGSTIPSMMAPITQSTFIVGPWPDLAYQVEVVGTQRPLPLSAGNPTTFLSQYLPDLMLAASMIFGAGFQKNFGAMVDDPKAAVTWESHYNTLLESANKEEMMKKFAAEGWSSKNPDKIATPPRT